VVAGYGGHAGYAMAVSRFLRGARASFLVPRGYWWVAEKLGGLGEVIEASLPRRPSEPMYRSLPRWPRALAESVSLCRRGFNAVLATGSNFSLAPSIACMIAGSRVYTLEAIDRISSPSRSVALLRRLGARVFLHWEEQLAIHPRGVVAGPVYEPRVYEPRDDGYLLVTTGTLGFKELYDAVISLDAGRVVLQTGDVDPGIYQGRAWRAFSYTGDLHRWIAGASVVVTQYPGMTAATARLAYRKPVVMVYSRRHRLSSPPRDGYVLSEKLRAPYIEKPDPEALEDAMREARRTPPPSYPNGARVIAEVLLSGE